jgi:hypothetical protein
MGIGMKADGKPEEKFTQISGKTGGYYSLLLSFPDHFDSLLAASSSSRSGISPAIESKSEFPQFLGALLIQCCWVAGFSLPIEEDWGVILVDCRALRQWKC